MISNRDVLVVGNALGKIVRNIGILLLFPIPIAIAYMEFDIIPDFIMAASVAFLLSNILQILFKSDDELKFRHAIIVSTMIYGIGSVLAGLPLWTSGSLNTILDGTFDGMSGWTGTGLSMIPDIDHLSYAINFWRHFIQFVGGAGIVVFALALLTKSTPGLVKLYTSEGREEKLFPSITRTTRMIMGLCIFFLLVGSTMLSLAGWYGGMSLGESIFNAVTVTMAAFGTGGFAPHTQSIQFYHSIIYEIIVVMICLIGSFNFVLHLTVLTGNRSELKKNIEIITFTTTVIILTVITMAFLLYFNIYSDYITLFRRGFFQLISGHTGAGLSNINPAQLSAEWPYLSLFAVTVAMLLGGSVGSTSAGIKALRVGVIIRLFISEIKKMILPDNAVIVQKYHHIHPAVINDKTARGALMVAAAYVILFTLGSLITMFYGYSMINSMFETSSALGNTGLSVNIATYQAPPMIKITYIFLMWAGRLEILAVFVLLGVVYLAIKRATQISTGVYHTGEIAAKKIIPKNR